ncbi:MAG: hemerythrin domain-containing protein [Vampirovibrionales bacterium]|nr:hemerythrin domain-containing protein [Vampirovibrionales bacterium]
MDFFSLLKQEHQEAKDLFEEILDTEPIDRAKTELLCEKLKLHMEMEETFFYPEIEDLKKTKEMTQEGELEHDEAKKYMKALLKSDLDDIEYKVKLEMLKLSVVHHVDEEESDLFPEAKKVLSKTQIDRITDEMKAYKSKKSGAKQPAMA